MKFLFFLLLFFNVINPYTLILVSPTDDHNWYHNAQEQIKNIKKELKFKYKDGQLEKKERIEIFPNAIFREKDFVDFYKTYNTQTIAKEFAKIIEDRIDFTREVTNVYLVGSSIEIIANAISLIDKKYFGDIEIVGSFRQRSNSIISELDPDTPREEIEQHQSRALDIIDRIKSIASNQNLQLVAKITVAICGTTTLVVTTVVTPIITIIIPLVT